MYPTVTCITATKGRHTTLERIVKCFVDQDYIGIHTLLIYNNSFIEQQLDRFIENLPENKNVKLINNCKNLETGKSYASLGEIYVDALKFVDSDISSFLDDDEIILKNHISEGVKGYQEAKTKGKLAYKPKKSYYRSLEGVSLVENTMEPSIFLETKILKEVGFYNLSGRQHLKWVEYLRDNDLMFCDPNGTPTLIYNWGDHNIPTFKTSGDINNPLNFQNYERFSQDHGDRVITPISDEEIIKYYNQIKS